MKQTPESIALTEQIITLRDAGLTWGQIALRVGRSRNNCQQRYLAARTPSERQRRKHAEALVETLRADNARLFTALQRASEELDAVERQCAELTQALAVAEQTFKQHGAIVRALTARIAELEHGSAREVRRWWDETRCRVCGWPLAESADKGCVPGNCSQRPLPAERADRGYMRGEGQGE